MTWEARLEGGKKYAISLVNACSPGAEGGELEITIGSETIIFTTSATGSWKDFVESAAGSYTASRSGPVEVRLRARKIPGEALINLRSLVFTPQ